MSSYAKITKHPTTGKYALARWIDDYFAPHYYGVKFPDDDKVYPAEFVEERQIHDFWADDVINAFRYVMGLETKVYNQQPYLEQNELLVAFLNQIEKEYKARWQLDPISGNGATEKSVVVKRLMSSLEGPCDHYVQYGECVKCRLVIEDEE